MAVNPIASIRIGEIERDIKEVMQEVECLEQMNASGTQDEDGNLERIAELEIYLEKLSDELWLLGQNR